MKAKSDVLFTQIESPVGDLLLVGDRAAATQPPARLRGLYFAAAPHAKGVVPAGAREDRTAFARAIEQLADYFAGKRTSFDLELSPAGTDFQRAVWTALAAIPYGETRTYAAIARAIGRPRAVRAVGAANGRNPLSIVVPCHRVIGRDGTLTGYAGGVEHKETLLTLEQRGSRRRFDVFQCGGAGSGAGSR
jgi:methylated-DNA-[protein]-cysteine S-methyltransferase